MAVSEPADFLCPRLCQGMGCSAHAKCMDSTALGRAQHSLVLLAPFGFRVYRSIVLPHIPARRPDFVSRSTPLCQSMPSRPWRRGGLVPVEAAQQQSDEQQQQQLLQEQERQQKRARRLLEINVMHREIDREFDLMQMVFDAWARGGGARKRLRRRRSSPSRRARSRTIGRRRSALRLSPRMKLQEHKQHQQAAAASAGRGSFARGGQKLPKPSKTICQGNPRFSEQPAPSSASGAAAVLGCCEVLIVELR